MKELETSELKTSDNKEEMRKNLHQYGKEVGFNYFTIVNCVCLSASAGYYRITIKNHYVACNDIDIILCCRQEPVIGKRIEIKAINTWE